MNSSEIFSLALGLPSPWRIEKVEFSKETTKELHIYIGYEKTFKMFKNVAGLSNIYDHKSKVWRHLNFFEHKSYIHCEVPRIINADGNVEQVEVPWARAGSGFTLLFEAFSMCLIEKEMPVSQVGSLLKEYPNRIWTIFKYWITKAYNEADHSQVKQLGIDETSIAKGHKYVTVSVDMEKGNVLHATEGKGIEAIASTANYLTQKGSSSRNIKEVCIDLSPSFISGVQQYFPNASITFDRFHVQMLVNKAMDDVRKAEYKLHKEELKNSRYLFLKKEEALTQEQKYMKYQVINLLPSIGEAYRLKELFKTFYEIKDAEEAQGYLQYWCDVVRETKIEPFKKIIKTINAHWSGIIRYSQSKLNNGILEGINSKIQLAKKRARGFRNIDNFIAMIYFTCGKLKFNYPHYST